MLGQTLFSQLYQRNAGIFALSWEKSHLAPEFHQSLLQWHELWLKYGPFFFSKTGGEGGMFTGFSGGEGGSFYPGQYPPQGGEGGQFIPVGPNGGQAGFCFRKSSGPLTEGLSL